MRIQVKLLRLAQPKTESKERGKKKKRNCLELERKLNGVELIAGLDFRLYTCIDVC